MIKQRRKKEKKGYKKAKDLNQRSKQSALQLANNGGGASENFYIRKKIKNHRTQV